MFCPWKMDIGNRCKHSPAIVSLNSMPVNSLKPNLPGETRNIYNNRYFQYVVVTEKCAFSLHVTLNHIPWLI